MGTHELIEDTWYSFGMLHLLALITHTSTQYFDDALYIQYIASKFGEHYMSLANQTKEHNW